MSDKEQQETERSGWLREAELWLKERWHRILLGVPVIAISYCICSPYLSPKQRATNNDHTHLVWYLIGLAVTGVGVLCIPRVITSNPKKYFITRVLVTGITGGAFALLLPIAVKSTTTGVGGLRHSILLATGGLLAILTLGETRRKNDIDKRKNKQEKKKNDKDYRRQVRAERRERYTKAVEQLGDEKTPVRMGGVYTLVGLVDEWLEEKSLSDDERFKEGQVIINNLCAYIRSPFTLTSYYDELSEDAPSLEGSYKDKKEEFYVDKAILDSEADVRLSIIKEIHDRIQGPDKNTPGAWSDFEYDFSGSTFFYPIDLTNSYYAKPINFSGSTYEGWANFSGSTYQGEANFSRSTYQALAYFSGSTYQGGANFNGSTYQALADFSRSTYQGEANFSGSTYEDGAYFSRSTYQAWANFSGSVYQAWANFNGSTYQGEANFNDSTYQVWADFSRSTYQAWANFSRSTYQGEANFNGSTYQGEANFNGSTYKSGADFSRSTYKSGADFSRSTYKSGADFSRSTYKSGANFGRSTYENETDFSGSIFYQETYFGEGRYSNSSSCFTNHAPQFYDKTNHKNTLFGSHNNDFTVDIDKGYPINLNSEGLPLGCKILTSEQKEYLEYKFQEIEKIQNELFEVKDPEKKVELSKKLWSLNEELHEWREEATTVKVEDVATEDTES